MKQKWYDLPTDLPPESSDPKARSLLRSNLLKLTLVALIPALLEIILPLLRHSTASGGQFSWPVLLLSLILAALLLLGSVLGKSLSIAMLRLLQVILGLGSVLLGMIAGAATTWPAGSTSFYLLALIAVFSISVWPLADCIALVIPAFTVHTILLFNAGGPASEAWGNLIIALAANLFLIRLSSSVMASKARHWADQVQLADLKAKVGDMNQRDMATGLYNRLTIRSRLADEIARSNRFKTPLCILTIDIDDLDFINKQQGTATGDLVILTVARTLTKTLRTTDVIGRHGADEFIVILPNTDLDNARIAVRRIQDAIAANDPGTTGQATITVSGGLSQYKGELAETLIMINEARLRQAKSQGKHQFVME